MENNQKKLIAKIKIEADIQEIENVLNNPFKFDRNKAISIIEKHHFSDWNICIADMVLNVNQMSLYTATDRAIASYLYVIELYLNFKLTQGK